MFPYNNDDNLDANSTENHSNDTDDEICNVLGSQSFNVKFLYVLVSVYVGFIISSIVLLLVIVDHLPTCNSFFSAEKKVELYLIKLLIELLKGLKDVKMLLIAPIVVYGGMELAFAFGSFTEVGTDLHVLCVYFILSIVCIMNESGKTTEGHYCIHVYANLLR